MPVSTALDLSRYNTDKMQSGYLPIYDRLFTELVDRPVKLLELGVKDGGSLLLWRDYFSQGDVVGVDLTLPAAVQGVERVHGYAGDQADTRLLDEISARHAPGGWDIIIDDASHVGSLTAHSFNTLFGSWLKPSGIYVIEDWGTGYWPEWPDGRAIGQMPLKVRLDHWWTKISRRQARDRREYPSHSAGMVGFVKSLVDETGACDFRDRGKLAHELPLPPRIGRLEFSYGLCIAHKAPWSASPHAPHGGPVTPSSLRSHSHT